MCCRDTSIYPFKQSLASITLNAEQRILIEERYVRLLVISQQRCHKIAYLYHSTRCITTIGSIIVPALLSIQYTNGAPFSEFTQSVYWATWFISLLVTVSNGMLTLFKFDKKYYLLYTSYEQLKTEGWQYLALTGRYAGNSHDGTATHDAQFRNFCKTIEKLRMRQMEEEYVRIQEVDKSHPAPPATQVPQGSIPSLVEMNKTPDKDDILVKIAALLTSGSAVGKTQKTTDELEQALLSSDGNIQLSEAGENTQNTPST
jgi:hypothetical protein